MSTSLTTLRAAAMWSCLIWSTVALNSWVPSSPALPRMLENEPERLAMLPLLRNGVDAPDRPPVTEFERVKIWVVRGLILSELATPGVIAGLDVLPTAVEGSGARGRSASIAARSSRFVVPVALDSPERAEQTSATRFPESMKELDLESAVFSTEPNSGPVHPLRYLPPPLLPQPLPSLCIHSDESRDQMASRRSKAPRLHPRHRRALLLRSQHSRDDLLRYRFHELADARPAVLLDLCRGVRELWKRGADARSKARRLGSGGAASAKAARRAGTGSTTRWTTWWARRDGRKVTGRREHAQDERVISQSCSLFFLDSIEEIRQQMSSLLKTRR